MSVTPLTPAERMRPALRLEAVTLLCLIAEASVSLGAGVLSRSLLLVAFGVDSVIELVSAGVLFRRLCGEARARTGDAEAVAGMERQASRLSGGLLYALSAYVVLQAVYGLAHRHRAETSWAGLAVALAAAFGMPVLARAKIREADRIGSRALRADAMETLTCGHLSWALLAGLAADALLHWWWLDAAASLAIVPLLVREAREAMSEQTGPGRRAARTGRPPSRTGSPGRRR